jgi:hypothetical protein
MSKVKIQGNASGTGVVTLTAPNTNTDRTITLPDGDISLGVGIDDNATSTAITIDASENVEINTGNLVIGTSGKGIDFSATSDGSGSTGSEVLDDYEEGTWTPVLTGAGGGTHSGSGLYTKVGNIVHVSFKNENFSNTGFSGILTITGLPFAAISEQANVFGLTYNLSFTGYTSISAQTDGGGGVLRLVKSGSGLGYADLNATDLNATGNYHRSTLTYRIA